jgi:hypothetical protein
MTKCISNIQQLHCMRVYLYNYIILTKRERTFSEITPLVFSLLSVFMIPPRIPACVAGISAGAHSDKKVNTKHSIPVMLPGWTSTLSMHIFCFCKNNGYTGFCTYCVHKCFSKSFFSISLYKDLRPYSKSSLTLTLNEWKFNLSFSRVSLLFLNS